MKLEKIWIIEWKGKWMKALKTLELEIGLLNGWINRYKILKGKGVRTLENAIRTLFSFHRNPILTRLFYDFLDSYMED